MDKQTIIPLIFLIIGVVLTGYLVLDVMINEVTRECIRQNATFNNITKMWDGCEINALA